MICTGEFLGGPCPNQALGEWEGRAMCKRHLSPWLVNIFLELVASESRAEAIANAFKDLLAAQPQEGWEGTAAQHAAVEACWARLAALGVTP